MEVLIGTLLFLSFLVKLATLYSEQKGGGK